MSEGEGESPEAVRPAELVAPIWTRARLEAARRREVSEGSSDSGDEAEHEGGPTTQRGGGGDHWSTDDTAIGGKDIERTQHLSSGKQTMIRYLLPLSVSLVLVWAFHCSMTILLTFIALATKNIPILSILHVIDNHHFIVVIFGHHRRSWRHYR